MKRLKLLSASAALWCVGGLAFGQHVHMNVGAVGTSQGDQLYLVNGASYVTNSGYCQPLLFTNANEWSNYYQGSPVSFVALPATLDNGGPDSQAPALGSQIRLRFVSCAGPVGGSFGVWDIPGLEQADFTDFPEPDPSTTLTFSLPTGTINGTNTILLSMNHGEPGVDPFGHIHGRVFSATVPGLYTIGVQLIDTSANGAGNGPIHSPSITNYLYWQAGFTNPPLTFQSNRVDFTFGGLRGTTYRLEATTNLGVASTTWTNLATVAGTNFIRVLSDTNATGAKKYYRVRMTRP